jgi:hypothetical protein
MMGEMRTLLAELAATDVDRVLAMDSHVSADAPLYSGARSSG